MVSDNKWPVCCRNPQDMEPVMELQDELDLLPCWANLTLALPLAGPRSSPLWLPPKFFQVFESSWAWQVGWLLRERELFSRKMRKLLSSFLHHPSERVVVMPCQWRAPHHPLAPHSHRERLTSVCSSRRRLSFLLLLLFFFFHKKQHFP